MKTRDLKSELRLKQKLITRGNGYPGNNEGREGDFTVRWVPGRGLFFFYKWGNKWYQTRLSTRTPRNDEANDPVLLPKGKEPTRVGEITLGSDNKVRFVNKEGSRKQAVSVDKDKVLDVTELQTSRASTASMTTDNAGTADFFLFNQTGHVSINLRTNSATHDPFILYSHLFAGETAAVRQWAVGMDNGDDTFMWNYKSVSTEPLTPSTTDASFKKLQLETTGNLTALGTIKGTKLLATSTVAATSDTDKFLVIGESGATSEIRFRTGAEVLSDIGAQASLTFGISDTNVTKCGAGIVDDDFIRVNGTTFEGRSASEVRSDIGAGTSSVGALNDLSDVTYSSGDLTISSLDKIISGDLLFDSSGAIKLDTTNASNGANDGLLFYTAGTQLGALTSHHSLTSLTLYEAGGASTADYFDIVVDAAGATTIGTTDAAATAAHLTLNPDGNLIASIGDANEAASAFHVNIQSANNRMLSIYGEIDNYSSLIMYEMGGQSTADYFQIKVGEEGATTISTVDGNAAAANMQMSIDGTMSIASAGTLTLDCADRISIDTTDRCFFKNGGTTFAEIRVDTTSQLVLYEQGGASTDDYFVISTTTAGDTTIATVDAAGATGHLNIEPDGHVEFDGCGVGFDLVTPSYASDTVVDFKTGNKQFVTFGSGSITNLQCHFPATSGNFVVLIKQDGTGSRTITNYKAYDSAGNAANGSAAVKFPGGTNPTLTTAANHVDIVSFFWDADNEIAYGVATLDFQD